MKLKFIFSIQILFFVFFSKFQKTFSLNIPEKFPFTYKMSNGDIFVITANGIRVFDSTLKIEKYSRDFTCTLITTMEEAAKTTITQFPNEYILTIYNDILFVCSSEGVYKFEVDLADLEGNYYSLIAHKKESSDIYYYIITFFKEEKLNIYYFKLIISSQSSEQIANIQYTPYNSNGESSTLMYQGLSCQIMSKDTDEVLACFYEVNYPPAMSVRLFQISDTSTTNQIVEILTERIFSANERATVIKSAISNDKKSALICYIMDNNGGFCLNYNIDSNSFSQEAKYINSCREKIITMNVYYFEQKDEYMFICNDNANQNGYDVVNFNSNFEASIINNEIITEPNYKYGGTCMTNSFNILYLPDANDYIIINDCTNGDDTYITGNINLSKLSGENNYPNENMDIIINGNSQNNNANDNDKTNKMNEMTKKNNTLIINSSTKTKEEIINNLDELIKDKNPEQSYIINGDDYIVIITPVNEYVEESSVHIDFSECEKLLKEKYPLKTFRILQINMENKNQKIITDQVEYKIYDENGIEINLSICKDVNIIIEYEIKNTSLLNINEISNFKEQGIDIFNIQHEFFNDICYSYSDNNSNSDMILSDRVSDIYQNYSICGEKCEYDSFNIDKLSANCNCKIKEELNSELEKGNFQTYFKKAFFKSNFGIIKCFKSVFSIKGKLKNYGFWIFGSMICAHLPLYIIYFINGITPVRKFILNEMNNKGYTEKNIQNQIKNSENSQIRETTNDELKDNKNVISRNLKHKKSKKHSKNNKNSNPTKKRLNPDKKNKNKKRLTEIPQRENKLRKQDDNIISDNEINIKNNNTRVNIKKRAKTKKYDIKKGNLTSFNNKLETQTIVIRKKMIKMKIKKLKSMKIIISKIQKI